MPHFLGGKQFSAMIEENKLDVRKFLQKKKVHLEHLQQRRLLRQQHPRHENS